MSNPEILTYVPFARDGERNLIPVTRKDGQDARLATFSEGYPKITMTPKSAGGEPPDGMDMNGALYQISLDTVHRQSGKQMQYDATYATNIGGYSKGSVLQSTDLSTFWISTVDGNTTDPDSTSASGWNRFAYTPVATSTTTGTVKLADTLASNATDTALTANQGKILANMLSGNPNIGYQWVGGILIQWGNRIGMQLGETRVPFNIPFPNKAIFVMASNSSKGNNNSHGIVSYLNEKDNPNSFICSVRQISGNLPVDASWFAIGN